jgi:hypothetical protein
MAGIKITDLDNIEVTSQTGYLIASTDDESGKVRVSTFMNDIIAPELDARYSDWTNQITISTAAQGSTVTLTPNTHETFILSSVTSPSLSSFTIKLPKASNSFIGQSKTIISTKDIGTIIVGVDANSGYTSNATKIGNALEYLLAYQPVCYLCIQVQNSTQSVTWVRVA